MSYMTFELTPKQSEVLHAIRAAGQVGSTYALAKSLGRPYRRVRDHVQLLAKAGLIEHSEPPRHNPRAGASIKAVLADRPEARAQPELSYRRHWSSPVTGVDDDVLIAGVIAEPTLDDLIACCLHYGVARVRDVYSRMLATGEIGVAVQRAAGRMLANVEIGFSRAA